jgi:SAM-dependent methyltransferase
MEQMFFFANVRNFFSDYFTNKKVLEIGSLDINGSVRGFFEDCAYTGIDIGPGPKVDIVCNGEDFSEKANQFDVVLSTEVFEHTANWDLIFMNMLRLVKRDGIVIFSCASWGRVQHGTTLFDSNAAPHVANSSDYYRNLNEDDFRRAFQFDYWFSDYVFVRDLTCLYFVGIGKKEQRYNNSMSNFKVAYEQYLYKKNILGLPHDYILQHSR